MRAREKTCKRTAYLESERSVASAAVPQGGLSSLYETLQADWSTACESPSIAHANGEEELPRSFPTLRYDRGCVWYLRRLSAV